MRLEAEGVPTPVTQFAMLLDRLFRFPVTGDRVRNYDGLGGQLLFAYLHRHDVLRWTDNRLTSTGSGAPRVIDLCAEIEALYREGIDRPSSPTGSRRTSWSRAMFPHPGSTWAKGSEALPLDRPPRKIVDEVLPDEFPLSIFYEALSRSCRSDRLHQGDHRGEYRAGAAERCATARRRHGERVSRCGDRGRGRRRTRRPGDTAQARRGRRDRRRLGQRPGAARGGPWTRPLPHGGGTVSATPSTCSTCSRPGTGPPVEKDFGRVDGLVHLVGGWRGSESFTKSDLDDWDLLDSCSSARVQHTSLAFHEALQRSDRAGTS